MDGFSLPAGQVIMANDVIVYSTRFCPFCIRAKQLLTKKGVAFRDIAVDGDPQLREKMTQEAGSRTVPQIWINGQHIGGCSELMTLDASGDLDRMLNN